MSSATARSTMKRTRDPSEAESKVGAVSRLQNDGGGSNAATAAPRNMDPPFDPVRAFTGDTHVANKWALARTVFSGFWDEGRLTEDNCIEYQGLNLTIGDDLYEIEVGDAVMMRAEDGSSDEDRRSPRVHQRKQQQQQQLKGSGVGNSNSRQAHDDALLGSKVSTTQTSDYTVDASSDETNADYYGGAVNELDTLGSTSIPTMKESKIGDGLMLARVENIWQEKGRGGRTGKVMFSSRWFLKKDDVDAIPLNGINGPDDFANRITEHDLVLSNQSDENHVTTICGLIQVLYRRPNSDRELPAHILPTTYICRYSLSLGDDEDHPSISVLPFVGEDDEWGMMTLAAVTPPAQRSLGSNNEEDGKGQRQPLSHQNHGKTARGGLFKAKDYTSDDEMSFGEHRTKKKLRVNEVVDEGINEGTTEQRDIRVGREHQVHVPPFTANQRSVSRNPTCVWRPGVIVQDEIDSYIQQAAEMLTPYLRENRWTHEEPYSPFPIERMEELNQSVNWSRLPTLSSVATASSLASVRRVDALREFDVDALLWNLSASNYDVKTALVSIEASPRDYLTVWSPRERTLFNNGFRRYAGSLRAIYKHMGNKDLEDVIDYHYRFKIPDQYRRSQDRKREQAIRMLECIETRRNLNAPILVPSGLRTELGSNDENTKNGDWSRSGISDVATSLVERRVKAKELLLDVQSQLGTNKMVEVFNVITDHQNHSSAIQSKTKLLEILRGHKDFQSRFLDFLPQELRL